MLKTMLMSILGLVLLISLIVGACAAPKAVEEEPTGLTIAGGSVGGSTQLWANACAGLAKKYLDINATVITWPTSAMERGLHEGISDIASAKVNQIYMAQDLTGYYEGYSEPMPDLRPLFFTMPATMQIVVLAESPFKTFRDLIGQRISPGSTAFSPDMYLRTALPAIGLDYEGDFTVVYVASHKEGATALVAGKIDAYFLSGAPPQPTFMEVNLVHPLRLIGFTEEDMEAITTKLPRYASEVLQPEFYNMDKPVLTYGSPTIGTATTRLPEEIAYALTKYYIEDPEYVSFYHSGFGDYIVKGVPKEFAEKVLMPVPYHPGAYRYYKEVGYSIPSEMIP